jgi:uncharacterized protein (DUF1778 family)
LGLSREAKQKLKVAASAAQRSLSEFVLESALIRADETLADRARFNLGAKAWEAFLEPFDAPPRGLPRLKRLFAETGASHFERSR